MHVSQPAVSQGYLCQAQKAGAAGRLLSYLFLVTKPFGAFLLSLINSAMFECVACTCEGMQPFGPSFDTEEEAWSWFHSLDKERYEDFIPAYSSIRVLDQKECVIYHRICTLNR